MVEHALAVSDVHNAVLKTHDAASRDLELKVRHDARGVHARHDATGGTEDLNDLARVLVRALDNGLLDRLQLVAVLVLLKQNAGTTDLELKALAAHGLHQDRQVQDAAARDLDAALVLELLDLHGHVVLGLVEQALLELTGAHDVAIAADEWGGRSLKDDGQGRRVDLDGLELDGVLGIGVDIADIGAVNTHDSSDIAGADFLALSAAQVVKGKELLDGSGGAGAVVLDDQNLVALVNGAGVHATDTDAANEVGVVDGHALHGQRGVLVNLGRRHVVDDHIEQRIHVHIAVVGVKAGKAIHGAGVDHVLHGELKLVVGSAQVGHKVQAVVVGLLGVGARTIDLVDDDHDLEAGVDSVTQHEAGLGHGALKGVDQQQGAVGHTQHALDLAAKVGVARGVDDVDLDVLVLDRDVLGENRNAALALLVVRVQDAVLDLLVGTEGVRGTQELIDHRRLAVVDVGDDGDVSQIVYAHVVPLSSIHIQTARVCGPPSDTTLGGNIEPFTENSFILAILNERGFLTCRFRVAPHKTIAGTHALIQHICRKAALERGFEEAHEQSVMVAAVNLNTAGIADGIAGDTAQALVLKAHLVLGDKVGGSLEARLFAVLVKRRQISVGSSVLDRHDYARILAGGKVVQERTNQVTHHGVELGGDVTGVLHILCHL